MRKKKGFTLIELLVVISIIALLLSILMPALTKVKVQARRIVCRTNLHQWAIAFENYSASNNGKSCSAFGYTDPLVFGLITDVVPNEFWYEDDNTTGNPIYDHPGQYSWELLADFMPSGFNPKGLTRAEAATLNVDDPEARDLILEGAWTCPSFRVVNERDMIQDNLWRIQQRGFLRLRYSYYGRSDLWVNGDGNIVTNPRDFGGNSPGSRHLLMTDSLYAWQNLLDHNHSEASKIEQIEIMWTGTEPDIAGINKLFGDGSALWKDRRDFQGPNADPTLIDISGGPSSSMRRVSSIGNQALNWY